jgi:hypothetical protein
VRDTFGFTPTITLYDLTNTYMEGNAEGNPKAERGRSKEKRSGCPLLTPGLTLDASGFIRHSQVFDGNVSEGSTLEEMLKQLHAPEGALIVMDAGIASEENLERLTLNIYNYLVVSRERKRDPVNQRIGRLKEKCKRVSGHYRINLQTNEATGLVTELTRDYQPQPAGKQTHPGVCKLRTTLREKLGQQLRITATFKQRDGKTPHIRQATRPEEEPGETYKKPGLSSDPGGLQRVRI